MKRRLVKIAVQFFKTNIPKKSNDKGKENIVTITNRKKSVSSSVSTKREIQLLNSFFFLECKWLNYICGIF
jgi:hypothetical protein